MRVILAPPIQRALNVLSLSGGWAFPQPAEALRAAQQTLLDLGYAEVIEGVGQEVGRRFLHITDEGRRHVQKVGYGR